MSEDRNRKMNSRQSTTGTVPKPKCRNNTSASSTYERDTSNSPHSWTNNNLQSSESVSPAVRRLNLPGGAHLAQLAASGDYLRTSNNSRRNLSFPNFCGSASAIMNTTTTAGVQERSHTTSSGPLNISAAVAAAVNGAMAATPNTSSSSSRRDSSGTTPKCDNLTKYPDKKQIEDRLRQIQEYLQITTSLMSSMKNTDEQQSAEDGGGDEKENLTQMIKDLKDSEEKLLDILKHANEDFDGDDGNNAAAEQSGELNEQQQGFENGVDNTSDSGLSSSNRNELDDKMEHTNREIDLLRDQQMTLLSLQQKAENKLRDARQIQEKLSMPQYTNDVNDVTNQLQSTKNFGSIDAAIKQLEERSKRLNEPPRPVPSSTSSNNIQADSFLADVETLHNQIIDLHGANDDRQQLIQVLDNRDAELRAQHVDLQNKLQQLQTRKSQVDQLVSQLQDMDGSCGGEGDDVGAQVRRIMTMKDQLTKLKDMLEIVKTTEAVVQNTNSTREEQELACAICEKAESLLQKDCCDVPAATAAGGGSSENNLATLPNQNENNLRYDNNTAAAALMLNESRHKQVNKNAIVSSGDRGQHQLQQQQSQGGTSSFGGGGSGGGGSSSSTTSGGGARPKAVKTNSNNKMTLQAELAAKKRELEDIMGKHKAGTSNLNHDVGNDTKSEFSCSSNTLFDTTAASHQGWQPLTCEHNRFDSSDRYSSEEDEDEVEEEDGPDDVNEYSDLDTHHQTHHQQSQQNLCYPTAATMMPSSNYNARSTKSVGCGGSNHGKHQQPHSQQQQQQQQHQHLQQQRQQRDPSAISDYGFNRQDRERSTTSSMMIGQRRDRNARSNSVTTGGTCSRERGRSNSEQENKNQVQKQLELIKSVCDSMLEQTTINKDHHHQQQHQQQQQTTILNAVQQLRNNLTPSPLYSEPASRRFASSPNPNAMNALNVVNPLVESPPSPTPMMTSSSSSAWACPMNNVHHPLQHHNNTANSSANTSSTVAEQQQQQNSWLVTNTLQTQAFMLNTLNQCCQMLWLQQRELMNLRQTVGQLQDRMENPTFDNLHNINNSSTSHLTSPLQQPQQQQAPPIVDAPRLSNQYRCSNQIKTNQQQQQQVSGACSMPNLNQYNVAIPPPSASSVNLDPSQYHHTNSNLVQQQNVNRCSDPNNSAGSISMAATPLQSCLNNHNPNLNVMHLNNNNNNSNAGTEHLNTINNGVLHVATSALNACSSNLNHHLHQHPAAQSQPQQLAAPATAPLPPNQMAWNGQALNNQVAPGNRANNYWDNFRSYSRQNLLSTKSNDGTTSQNSLAAAMSGTTNPFSLVPTIVSSKSNSFSGQNAFLSSQENNSSSTISPQQRRPTTAITSHHQFVPTLRHNNETRGVANSNSATAPPDVLNVNHNLSTTTRAKDRALPAHQVRLPENAVRRETVNNVLGSSETESSTAHHCYHHVYLNNAFAYNSSGNHSNNHSSSNNNNNQNETSSNASNISEDLILKDCIPETARRRNEWHEEPATEEEQYPKSKLFEELRENVYKEVVSLITANEARPHFLIQLFRDLQMISSDPLRLRILQSIQSIITHSLVSSQQAHRQLLESQQAAPNDPIVPDGFSLQSTVWSKSSKNQASLPKNTLQMESYTSAEIQDVLAEAVIPYLNDHDEEDDVTHHLLMTLKQKLIDSDTFQKLVKDTVFKKHFANVMDDVLVQYIGNTVRNVKIHIIQTINDVLRAELSFIHLIQDAYPEDGACGGSGSSDSVAVGSTPESALLVTTATASQSHHSIGHHHHHQGHGHPSPIFEHASDPTIGGILNGSQQRMNQGNTDADVTGPGSTSAIPLTATIQNGDLAEADQGRGVGGGGGRSVDHDDDINDVVEGGRHDEDEIDEDEEEEDAEEEGAVGGFWDLRLEDAVIIVPSSPHPRPSSGSSSAQMQMNADEVDAASANSLDFPNNAESQSSQFIKQGLDQVPTRLPTKSRSNTPNRDRSTTSRSDHQPGQF